MPHQSLDSNSPVDTDAVASGDDEILNFKTATEDRMELDHWWEDNIDTASSEADGFHKKVSLSMSATDPTPIDGQIVVYSKIRSGLSYPELHEINHVGKPSAAAIMPVGTVIEFAGIVAPTGWLLCDGSEHNRVTYAALFEVIGETYGVPSTGTVFKVPDCRGRVTAGVDNGSANRLTAAKGHPSTLGAVNDGHLVRSSETHVLTANEMPSHSHTTSIALGGGFGVSCTPLSSGGPSTGCAYGSSAAGGGLEHDNVQPYICFQKLIKA
jgi:microcystin-dependent protein